MRSRPGRVCTAYSIIFANSACIPRLSTWASASGATFTGTVVGRFMASLLGRECSRHDTARPPDGETREARSSFHPRRVLRRRQHVPAAAEAEDGVGQRRVGARPEVVEQDPLVVHVALVPLVKADVKTQLRQVVLDVDQGLRLAALAVERLDQ